jgi:hypothetical protein
MTKNNFRLLDMDEHTREVKEKRLEKEIAACAVLGLILDASISDVTLCVENINGQLLTLV